MGGDYPTQRREGDLDLQKVNEIEKDDKNYKILS